jgi:putative ABC transport system permease protein
MAVAEPMDAATLARLVGVAPPEGMSIAAFEAVGGTVGVDGVVGLEDAVRDVSGIVLPFARLDGLRLAAPARGPDDAVAGLAGLTLRPWQARALGVETPWSDDDADVLQLLAPASWALEVGQTMTARLDGAQGTVVTPLTVAGVVDGPTPIAPSGLTGMLRAGIDRAINFDPDVGALVLAPAGYRGFRLYARSIDDVAALEAALLAMDPPVPTRTRSGAIERVRLLDQALTAVFVLLAALGIVGGVMAMTANTLAAVRRKTADLGVLRLLGFSRAALFGFPFAQSAVVAAAAATVSLGLFLLIAAAINRRLGPLLDLGEQLCRLSTPTLASAWLVIVGLACVCSLVGAVRAMAIDPREALRDG